jgi:molybdopterin/thiamine biosynthesis adenylyltransferase
MTNLDVRRHAELFDPYTFDTPVTIIGAGATGSWLALALAKLGITNITIYDFDIVEEHNVANQAYGREDIGIPKVEALESALVWHSDYRPIVKNAKFINQRLQGIVFCMVDSMAVRKQIWENSVKMKSAVKLFVEPRMGLNEARVYNVDPMNMEHIRRYEDCWYSDEEAEVSACGTSQTVISTALATASWCSRQLINFHAGVELDNEILLDLMYNNIYPTKW